MRLETRAASGRREDQLERELVDCAPKMRQVEIRHNSTLFYDLTKAGFVLLTYGCPPSATVFGPYKRRYSCAFRRTLIT